MRRRVDDAATAAGRDPRAIRRILNVGGTIADGPTRERLHGPPAHWIETLTGFVLELGFDTLILWPEGEVLPQIERFAADVAPAVRANLKRDSPSLG
jgi:hypothetical protein